MTVQTVLRFACAALATLRSAGIDAAGSEPDAFERWVTARAGSGARVLR